LPVSTVLRQLLMESGYYHYVGALPAGAQRQANLRALLQLAYEYEQNDYAGWYRFVRYLEESMKRGRDFPCPQIQASTDQRVQVMSIHSSKGLEFPVVSVVNLAAPFNRNQLRQDIIWQRQLGLAAKRSERDLRRKFPTLAYQAVHERLAAEAVAEEMRVF